MLNFMKTTLLLSMMASVIFSICTGCVDEILLSRPSDYGVRIEYILLGIFVFLSVLTYLLALLIALIGDKDDRFSIMAIIPVTVMSFPLIFCLGANGRASNSHVTAYFPLVTIQDKHFYTYDPVGKNKVDIDHANVTDILGKDFNNIPPSKFVSLRTVGYVNTACWDNKGFCRWVNYIMDKRRFVVEVQDVETKKILGNIIVYRVPFLMASNIYQEKTGSEPGQEHQKKSKTNYTDIESQVENAHAISGNN